MPSQDGLGMWLMLRKLKDDLESVIPGMRPEGPRVDKPMVQLGSAGAKAGETIPWPPPASEYSLNALYIK